MPNESVTALVNLRNTDDSSKTKKLVNSTGNAIMMIFWGGMYIIRAANAQATIKLSIIIIRLYLLEMLILK